MKRLDYLEQCLEVEKFEGNDKLLAIGRLCNFLLSKSYRKDLVTNFIKTTYGLSDKDSSYYVYSSSNYLKRAKIPLDRAVLCEYNPKDDDEKRCLVYDFVKKERILLPEDQWELIQFGSLLEGLYIESSRVFLNELPMDKEDKKHARFLVNIGRMQFLNRLLNTMVGPEISLGPKTLFYYSFGFLKDKEKTDQGLSGFAIGCKLSKIEMSKAINLAMSRSDFEKTFVMEKIFEGYEKKIIKS